MNCSLCHIPRQGSPDPFWGFQCADAPCMKGLTAIGDYSYLWRLFGFFFLFVGGLNFVLAYFAIRGVYRNRIKVFTLNNLQIVAQLVLILAASSRVLILWTDPLGDVGVYNVNLYNLIHRVPYFIFSSLGFILPIIWRKLLYPHLVQTTTRIFLTFSVGVSVLIIVLDLLRRTDFIALLLGCIALLNIVCGVIYAAKLTVRINSMLLPTAGGLESRRVSKENLRVASTTKKIRGQVTTFSFAYVMIIIATGFFLWGRNRDPVSRLRAMILIHSVELTTHIMFTIIFKPIHRKPRSRTGTGQMSSSSSRKASNSVSMRSANPRIVNRKTTKPSSSRVGTGVPRKGSTNSSMKRKQTKPLRKKTKKRKKGGGNSEEESGGGEEEERTGVVEMGIRTAWKSSNTCE